MSREKAHDEIYCRSCGEPIKKKAEICPECGVPNEFEEESRSNPRSRPRANDTSKQPKGGQSRESTNQSFFSSDSTEHDPNNYSTTVSDNFHYGIGGAILASVVGMAIPEGSSAAGFFLLVGWVLMPICTYYDRQYIRATTQWDPNPRLWILLTAIPAINIAGGSVYLFRRFNSQKVSPPNRGRGSKNIEDNALQQLRERYSKGELTDAEFEEKVEQIVGTEDAATAQMHMRSKETSQEKESN